MRRLRWPLLGAEAAVATWLAATPWLRAYHIRGTALLLAAAAVLSAAASILTAIRWRQPPVISYAASLGALVVLLLAAVSPNPTELARGLVHGPSYLLTATLPLTNPRWQLVAPVVATWVSGTVVSELLTRGRGTGGPAAVLLVSYVGGYALSSGAPGQPAGTGALLLVSLAALAMTREVVANLGRQQAGSAGGPNTGVARSLGGWACSAVVLAVIAWLVVPMLPGMQHPQASVARGVPTETDLALAPVRAIAALRDTDPKAAPVGLFRVETDGPSAGYFMLATLDQYDGDVWSFDRTFQPTGGRVPPPQHGSPVPLGAARAPRIRQRYTVIRSLGPSLPFLPYMDRPTDVSGVAVDVHAESGMIVPSARVRVPASYTVDSQAPAPTLDRVAPTSAVAPVSVGSDRQLPVEIGSDLTGVLRYLAAVTGQRPAPTIPFLQAASAAMQRTDRRIDPAAIPNSPSSAPPARGGTSLSEVINAVTVRGQATPEQFATLFVVVARSLGVPARLATGFRVQDPGGGPLRAGPHLVVDRQAWTWAEIPVAGVGWVVADPTPEQTASSEAPLPSGVQSPSTTVPPPQANAVPGNAPGGHALAPATHLALRHGHRSPLLAIGVGLLGVLALVFAIAALAFGLAAARRTIRRQLRRSADPAALAVGAWLELLDDLWRVGVAADDAATTGEVADTAGRQIGPEVTRPVRQIGEAADRALCSSQWAIDRRAAQSVWAMERALGREMRSRLPRQQRARAAFAVGGAPRRPISRRPPARRGPGTNRRDPRRPAP